MLNKKMHEVYENFPQEEKNIIDNIYKVVNDYCQEKSIKLAYDDRAENFVAAITEYYLESKEA
jgi:hypothetical protein